MNKMKIILGIILILAAVAIFVGCKYIISGTFVIVKDINFTAESGFYFYQVDITGEPDWEEHQADIAFVDAVGVEFHMTNENSTAVTFNAYIDDYSGLGPLPDSIPTSTASIIIEDLTVPPGTSIVSYFESLKFLKNIDRLKALTLTGKFDYYGQSTGNEGSDFVIDSGRVIVTFSASK
jgi:hypothetical protein